MEKPPHLVRVGIVVGGSSQVVVTGGVVVFVVFSPVPVEVERVTVYVVVRTVERVDLGSSLQ
jgi:hypothetical protein